MTGLDGAGGFAIDSKGNFWAANSGGLMRYPAGSTGNVKPAALVFGPATHYSGIGPVAVDSNDNVLVASRNPDHVLEFAPSAAGNIAPIAEISGSDTRLQDIVAIAVGP
jgi:hypothetical protein